MLRDPHLQWSAEHKDEIGVLTLSGDLLAKTRLEPDRILRDWSELDVLKIIICCEGLQHLDSAGLSTLLGPVPRARRRGGDVVLAAVNPQLSALFQVASLRKYFKVFETVDEARAYLEPLKVEPAESTEVAKPK